MMQKTSILLSVLFFLIACSPSKPRILVIGDSISIGYFPYVKKELSGEAVLIHNKGNAQSTGNGLKKIHEWIGNENWDIIQFNWGLWDLAHRLDSSTTKDKTDRKLTFTVKEYASNLGRLVHALKETHAKLIFVTTTYVPENSPGRLVEDAKRYNEAAIKIMKENGVLINNMYEKSKKIHAKYGKSPTNVHYTQDGYRELGKYISRFLRKEI